MAATTGSYKTISIHDYPEHLNPFHEEDNHNKIRFWTIGRKLNRSNSISFSGIKDLKNSWALRSFMRKGKKDKQTSLQEKKPSDQINGESSPVIYRRALQYSSTGSRSTVGSPERTDRYVYGGSITPLPRSRFQERLRRPSQQDVNSLSATPRMARSDVTGSRLSVESTNPFDEGPVPPVRASRRKKKRAPLPPQGADISLSSTNSELQINDPNETKASTTDTDLEIEKMNFNVELKIVEGNDIKGKESGSTTSPGAIKESNTESVEMSTSSQNITDNDSELKSDKQNEEIPRVTENKITNADSESNIHDKVAFPKVDIVKYRRNSSLNEDDIRLRRGNLEDFHSLSNKRSKSLTNTLDSIFVTYDINLNENRSEKDSNGNIEPQKVVCKVYDETSRKQSVDNSISSTEKEFLEIDKATRELEREINKLNVALSEDENSTGFRMSVSEIKRKFDKNDVTSPNPIPKPRRSHYGDSNSPVNGNYQT